MGEAVVTYPSALPIDDSKKGQLRAVKLYYENRAVQVSQAFMVCYQNSREQNTYFQLISLMRLKGACASTPHDESEYIHKLEKNT